jgi:MYXO-CTERM domain-containing protein
MKRIISSALAIGLTLGTAQFTHAATAIISLTDDPGTPATTEPDITTGNSGSVNYVAGYDITVGSSTIWVTSLGYYDPGHDGVADPNAQVGIYELVGPNESLDSVTAGSTASGFVGDYRFIALETPIELAANTTYRVVANVGNVSGTSHNETPLGGIPTFGSDLTINTSSSYSATIAGGGLTRPSLASGAPMIYLGNFEYTTTPVPEPSAALLGLLSLGGLLRRRR